MPPSPQLDSLYLFLTVAQPCQHIDFDIDMLGECDSIVTELCRRAGWDLKHEMIRDDKLDVHLHEGYESRYSFKIKAR